MGKAPPASPVPASKDRCIQTCVYAYAYVWHVRVKFMCVYLCTGMHLKEFIPVRSLLVLVHVNTYTNTRTSAYLGTSVPLCVREHVAVCPDRA